MKKELPQVCISDFTVRYAPNKEMGKITGSNKIAKDRAIKAHVKEFKMNHYPITLNSDNKFPTKNTEIRTLKTIWKYSKIKGNFEDHTVFVKDINVLSRSIVSYKFDYEKD